MALLESMSKWQKNDFGTFFALIRMQFRGNGTKRVWICSLFAWAVISIGRLKKAKERV